MRTSANTTPLHTIAIVGAGFSGTLAAVQLLRQAPASAGLRVLLIEKLAPWARGVAYRSWDDNLVLNVPAGNMSALPDEPGHFVAHCQRIDPAYNTGSFVPRRLYGDYLQALLVEAEQAQPGVLTRLDAEVVALHRPEAGTGWRLDLAEGDHLQADQVVLACGHSAPSAPAGWPTAGQHLVNNPWDLAAIDPLPHAPEAGPVLLLGSGHTAVDALFRLTSGGRRQVLMLSRRGLLPHGHRPCPKPPDSSGLPAFVAAVAPTARALLRAVRSAARDRMAAGGDWRDTMNELRPHTPALWQALPAPERQRFLRRLQPHWDVHRHRLAPTARHRLEGLLALGQTRVLAGQWLGAEQQGTGWLVHWRPRGEAQAQSLAVSAIVNCTGPDTRLHSQRSPLWQQLQREGRVNACPLQLGVLTDDRMQLLDRQHQAQDDLYYLGPWLKAQWWESTAVPELRQHAARQAQRCLQRWQAMAAAHNAPAAAGAAVLQQATRTQV